MHYFAVWQTAQQMPVVQLVFFTLPPPPPPSSKSTKCLASVFPHPRSQHEICWNQVWSPDDAEDIKRRGGFVEKCPSTSFFACIFVIYGTFRALLSCLGQVDHVANPVNCINYRVSVPPQQEPSLILDLIGRSHMKVWYLHIGIWFCLGLMTIKGLDCYLREDLL